MFNEIVIYFWLFVVGSLLALINVWAYIHFVDERPLPSKITKLFHHHWLGLIFILVGGIVYEHSIYLSLLLWGYGLVSFWQDSFYHIDEYIKEKVKEGRIK
jgi:hypothetical protein